MRTREDLNRELRRIALESGSANDFEKYEHSMSFARSFVEEEMHTLSYALKSLDAFMSYLSGIKGRKVLLYVCDGLTINPGEEIVVETIPSTTSKFITFGCDIHGYFIEKGTMTIN